mmetsp:Transcript_697/g.970  ORF Transcript_697/g.970 Transcript_697/m.970 type:complete len:357 (-) Transcript_697:115-1185(-)
MKSVERGKTLDPFSGDGFDPFGLSKNKPRPRSPVLHGGPSIDRDGSQSISIQGPPEVNRLTRASAEQRDPLEKSGGGGAFSLSEAIDDGDAISVSSARSMPLPPKLSIRFIIHEEVSSMALLDAENEGASEVCSEGTLQVQVRSSDANKNVPFVLIPAALSGSKIDFKANDEFTRKPKKIGLPFHVVDVPKPIMTPVSIGTYSLTEQVRHMPLLLERKVTMYNETCRVAVQVRSKLSNEGNLTDFTIAVALPERINVETIEVVRGNGTCDELKRTVKWTVGELVKGESFMVSALCKLWSRSTPADEANLRFPVLLRCTANLDKISSVEFRAMQADGHPASVQFTKTHSFRLLHRLK